MVWLESDVQKYIDIKEKPRDEFSYLCELIKEKDIRIFIEIGLWRGSMTKYILNTILGSFEEYWGIDTWRKFSSTDIKMDAYYNAISDQQWEEVAFRSYQNMIKFNRFRILRLDSIKAAKLFPNKYFDMIFIDADHSYEGVSKDIDAWFSKVRNGGILCGDDWDRGSVRKAVTEKEKQISILSNFSSYKRYWFMSVGANNGK